MISILLTLVVIAPAFGTILSYRQISKDNSILWGLDYSTSKWARSYWDITKAAWTWYGSYGSWGKVGMQVWANTGEWMGVGLFQGVKPFWPQESPNHFGLVPVDDGDIRMGWFGVMNGTWGTIQANLGVDCWFNVTYGGETKIAEIYWQFYQEGLLSFDFVGQRAISYRNDQSFEWLYEQYYYTQIQKNVWSSVGYITLNDEVTALKAYMDGTSDPDNEFYAHGTWRLQDFDSHLEICGGYYGNAIYTLDWMNVYQQL